MLSTERDFDFPRTLLDSAVFLCWSDPISCREETKDDQSWISWESYHIRNLSRWFDKLDETQERITRAKAGIVFLDCYEATISRYLIRLCVSNQLSVWISEMCTKYSNIKMKWKMWNSYSMLRIFSSYPTNSVSERSWVMAFRLLIHNQGDYSSVFVVWLTTIISGTKLFSGFS